MAVKARRITHSPALGTRAEYRGKTLREQRPGSRGGVFVPAAYVQEVGKQDRRRDDEASDACKPEPRRTHGRRKPLGIRGSAGLESKRGAAAHSYHPDLAV